MLLICFASNAQQLKKFNSYSYTVNKGLLVNRVVDVAEDNNGNDSRHLSVKDDGKGFDTKNVATGHGLYNMRHRAREAEYELNIFSNEEGTEITLKKNKSFT